MPLIGVEIRVLFGPNLPWRYKTVEMHKERGATKEKTYAARPEPATQAKTQSLIGLLRTVAENDARRSRKLPGSCGAPA